MKRDTAGSFFLTLKAFNEKCCFLSLMMPALTSIVRSCRPKSLDVVFSNPCRSGAYCARPSSEQNVRSISASAGSAFSAAFRTASMFSSCDPIESRGAVDLFDVLSVIQSPPMLTLISGDCDDKPSETFISARSSASSTVPNKSIPATALDKAAA